MAVLYYSLICGVFKIVVRAYKTMENIFRPICDEFSLIKLVKFA